MKLSKPLRIIRNLLLFFFISTTVTVVVYSFMPVYVTPLMIIRSVQQVLKGKAPHGITNGCRSISSPLTCLWPS